MSLKNYIFSSINTKGAQDSDKFATIRLKSLRVKKKMAVNGEDNPAPAPATVYPNQQLDTMNDNPNARQSDTTVAAQSAPRNPDETSAKHMHNDSQGNGNKKEEKFNCSWFLFSKGFLKIWSYFTIEPLMLCWLLPSCFLFIAVENLALEKVDANRIHLDTLISISLIQLSLFCVNSPLACSRAV